MKNNYFGYNIKLLRKLYNMSQEQMAKIVGKTYSAVSLWERELREPSNADVQAFCEYFGLEPADLMYRPLDQQVVSTPAEKEEELILLARLMNEEQYARLLNYAVDVLSETPDLTLGGLTDDSVQK